MRTALIAVATALVMAGFVVVRAGGVSALAGGGADSYAFLDHQPNRPDAPVTYSSCKPVRVELNLEGVDDEETAKRVVLRAMGEISAASHLNVVYVGDTDRRPRYPDETLTVEGGAWPVLIAFADATEVPDLAGNVAGVGGSAYIQGAEVAHYVTGQIAIDVDWFNDTLPRVAGEDRTRATVMHELGHVLGLDHVSDSRQIMSPGGRRDGELGDGDRRGLAILGQGPCF